MRKSNKYINRNIIKIILLVLVLILCVFLYYQFFYKSKNNSNTRDVKSGEVVLYLSSEKVNYRVGEEIIVKAYVDTGGKAINTVGIRLSYPTEFVEIERVDTLESFCELFPENHFDNTQGLLIYSCGLPTPGFSDNKGLVGVFYFKAKKIGNFEIEFTDKTVVLANDGMGTNVLSKTEDLKLVTSSD